MPQKLSQSLPNNQAIGEFYSPKGFLPFPDEQSENGPLPDLIVSDPPKHDLRTPEFYALYRLAFLSPVCAVCRVSKRGKSEMNIQSLPESPIPRPITVLLVEDEALFRLALPVALETNHPEITLVPVATFHEALALCKDMALTSQAFDCILLDLCLKQDPLNQSETIARTCQLAEFAPVIVLTGRIDDEPLALECIRAGADNLIAKDDLVSKETGKGVSLLIKKINYAIARAGGRKRIEEHRRQLNEAQAQTGELLERLERAIPKRGRVANGQEG